MSNYTSKHSGAEIDAAVEKLQGPLSLENGGTGATSLENAKANFGITQLENLLNNINFHTINVGDNTTITANMLQSALPPATTQLGGFNIIKVHGKYQNIGVLLFVGIMADKSGNSGAYGSGQYLSYYMGSTDITQVTLEGGDWVIH